jgi:hypothetical protein
MAAKGISLHIGVNSVDPNHYGGWSGPLQACEIDAEDLRELADAQGYQSHALLTGGATRDGVVQAIRDAAEALSDGDIFFITYSGHGGQVPDESGDEQDLADETWCLYDGQLVDDELYIEWSKFDAGVRVLVLSDSCHSGSVTRAALAMAQSETLTRGPVAEMLGTAGASYRYMPDDAALRTYRKNKSFYDDIQKAVSGERPRLQATIRLISGCQDNQLSLDGTFNGLFTGQLLRVWSSGAFDGNYEAFHKAILHRMPASQSPNHFVIGPPNPEFDEQKPFMI